MKAVVFSGTTEGRRFSKKLAALGAEVTVCVATPLGAEEQGEMAGITVHAGRLGPDAMAALLTGADLCVDATHPYAVDVTRNIRAAAAQVGVEYRRLLRARSPLPEDCVVFGPGQRAISCLPPVPRSWQRLRRWTRRGFIPGSCPRRRALPPARQPGSRTGTSLPCRDRFPAS